MTSFLIDIAAFVGNLFKPILFVAIIQIIFFTLLMEAKAGKNARAFGHAVFGYTMMAVGIALMTIGVVPTAIAALSNAGFTPEVYLSLLLVFAVGGALFLGADYQVKSLPAEVKSLPGNIYHFFLKSVGYLSLVLAAIHVCISLAVGNFQDPDWWVIPLALLLYGVLLAWLTSGPEKTATKAVPVAKKETPKKPAAKRKAPKRRKKSAK